MTFNVHIFNTVVNRLPLNSKIEMKLLPQDN